MDVPSRIMIIIMMTDYDLACDVGSQGTERRQGRGS